MKISIVLTTYNGEKFVTQQLESLLRQTRQPDEVLIFDDCSTDNTVKIIADFVVRHNLTHWNLKVNEKNMGWKENFKFGLLTAVGDLVFPCDQDDIWRQDKLSVCEKIMEENSNILVLVSNYEKFGDCRQEIVPKKNDKVINQINFNGNLFKVSYPGCSYCIRRTFLSKIEKYWTKNSPHDATVWRYALIMGGLFALNDNLILWRVYKTSTYELELMHNRNNERKRNWLDYAMGVLDDIELFLCENKQYQIENNIYALKKNKEWIEVRKHFYDKKNFFSGFKLLGYLRCYAAPIQYLGDWFHIFVK